METAGPLRPLSVPTRVENTDDLYEFPEDCDFLLETTEVSSFEALFYALRDLVADVHLFATPDDLSVNEKLANDNIFLSLKMKKNSPGLDRYECSRDAVLCFEPRVMHQCLAACTVGAQTRMSWRVKRHKNGAAASAFYIQVDIGSMEESGTVNDYTFEVPLLRSFKQKYTAPAKEMDYMLAMSTNMLMQIIDVFGSLKSEIMTRDVQISCSDDELAFSMVGGLGPVARGRFRLNLRRDDAPPRAESRRRAPAAGGPEALVDAPQGGGDACLKVAPMPQYSAVFSLVYLMRLQKCLAINKGFIYVFMRADYPLVFKTSVGTLGDMHIVLMYM